MNATALPGSLMRAFLASAYPACFMPKGALKKPLKIGIHYDIQSRHPDLPMEIIRAGLKDYTDGPKYLGQCVEGADRVDLDGKPVAKVTCWEENYSSQRLAQLQAEWDRPVAKSLGEILINAMNKVKDTGAMNEVSQNAFLSGRSHVVVTGELDTRSYLDTIGRMMVTPGEGAEAAIQLIEQREKRIMTQAANADAEITRRRKAMHASMQAVVSHLRADRKIEAIKLYRELSGVGLKEAKDFVESIQGSVQTSTPSYQQDGFIVVTKHADELLIRSEHDYLDTATASASSVAAQHNVETLLLRVLGKTKRTFALLP